MRRPAEHVTEHDQAGGPAEGSTRRMREGVPAIGLGRGPTPTHVSGGESAAIAIEDPAASSVVNGQELTIPERLAAAGRDIQVGWQHASGLVLVSDLLAKTDMMVRGIVGTPKSYLSDDQCKVYTDYPILDPVILYNRQPTPTPRPGAASSVTVTQFGGTVTINGLTFTETYRDLPPFQSGSEGLFLLKVVNDKHFPPGIFLGAFGISNGLLRQISGGINFAAEYRDVPVEKVTQEFLTVLLKRR